jgi:hypothetical protein
VNGNWFNESVRRCVCNDCGCTGPMAKSAEAAEFLAGRVGWSPKRGICASCDKVREGKVNKAPKPVKRAKP